MTSPQTSRSGLTAVTLRLVSNRSIAHVVHLGPEKPITVDGFGGWEVVPRPRRVGMTEWTGVTPVKATLQLLYDELDTSLSIASRLSHLTQNFYPAASAMREPPPFRIENAAPVSSGMSFVANGLTWIDYERDSKTRELVRAIITIEAIQFVAGEVIKKGTPAGRARDNASGGSASNSSKQYVVKAGDTLTKIAARELGDYRKASAIAKLNGIRDGNKLTIGDILRLP